MPERSRPDRTAAVTDRSGRRPAGLRLADRDGGRDNHFNLIRMCAASAVLVSHAYPIARGPGAVEPLQALLHGKTLGWVAVVIFFAISGYFITKSFDRSRSLPRFLAARALRLFPALLVVLLVTVLVAGIVVTTAPPDAFWRAAPGYVLRNLLLFRLDYDLPGVFETNPFGPPINGSLWTLVFEVLCYCGVVLAGLAGAIRRPRLFALGAAGLFAINLALPVLPLHPRIGTLMELALPFAAGATLYVWRDSVPLGPGIGLGLAALAVAAWWTPVFAPVLMVALAYGSIALGLAPARGLLGYNRLGDYSYGVYIYAFPIQQLAASWGVTTPLANMAVAAPLTLVCAVLSWHLVERPALQHVPGRTRSAHQKAAP